MERETQGVYVTGNTAGYTVVPARNGKIHQFSSSRRHHNPPLMKPPRIPSLPALSPLPSKCLSFRPLHCSKSRQAKTHQSAANVKMETAGVSPEEESCVRYPKCNSSQNSNCTRMASESLLLLPNIGSVSLGRT